MTETETMSLTVFDPITATGADLLKKDAAQEFDHTTPEGEKALRSWVHRLRGYKGDIEKCRKAAKASAIEFGRKVDDIARELTIMPVRLITARMKPLDEIEAKKRAEAEAKIEAERLEAERIEAERLADLKRREDEVARKEVEQKAAEEAANAEQREAERMQRERRIAESAAQTAREETEEKARVERETERERIRKDAEAAQAEKNKLDEIERKRVMDKAHRAQIEREALAVIGRIVGVNSDPVEISIRLLAAIIDGDIPNITINY